MDWEKFQSELLKPLPGMPEAVKAKATKEANDWDESVEEDAFAGVMMMQSQTKG